MFPISSRRQWTIWKGYTASRIYFGRISWWMTSTFTFIGLHRAVISKNKRCGKDYCMYAIVWGHLYVGSGRHLGRWGGSAEVTGNEILRDMQINLVWQGHPPPSDNNMHSSGSSQHTPTKWRCCSQNGMIMWWKCGSFLMHWRQRIKSQTRSRLTRMPRSCSKWSMISVLSSPHHSKNPIIPLGGR